MLNAREWERFYVFIMKKASRVIERLLIILY